MTAVVPVQSPKEAFGKTEHAEQKEQLAEQKEQAVDQKQKEVDRGGLSQGECIVIDVQIKVG